MQLQKIAIVAGEKSGDYLASEIVRVLKQRHPNAEFIGLAGPLMQAQGVRSLAEMEKISIMGFDGLFSSILEILSIRRRLKRFFREWQPDVFIGIDVPDFNLSLEKGLKQAGVPVVHCVSPTVWAWRGGRIKKIKASIHKMLALFPFEETYYRKHDTPVLCIGHPLANQVRTWSLPAEFVENYPQGQKTRIAILPGSRMSEVGRLASIMFAGASILAKQYGDLEFLIPAANPELAATMRDLEEFDPEHMRIVDGHSRDILFSSHIAVLASGTAALEAALFATPMVVMYQVSKLTAWHAGRTMQVDHYSMPNHLTSPPAVREFVQEEANVENMVTEVSKLLSDTSYYQAMHKALAAIAPELDKDFGVLSAQAIEGVVASLPSQRLAKHLRDSEQVMSEVELYRRRYAHINYLAGVDEVGRGPLAGPVVTAAVVLPQDYVLKGLTDSKKVSDKRRRSLSAQLKKDALSYAIGSCSVQEIDELNILNATMLAMQRAVSGLSIQPEQILVDGNRCPDFSAFTDAHALAIVKGDGLVDCISAASIIAKVYRDDLMSAYSHEYPEYGFESNSGYPTAQHRQALIEYGVTPIHRRSFAPVAKLIAQQS